MAARGKPLAPVTPALVPIELSDYSESARRVIEKDLRLLQAALAADRIIVTRDDSLRVALSQRPDGTALLQSVKWINPIADGPESLKSL